MSQKGYNMTYQGDIQDKYQLGSFKRLKKLVDKHKYPYDFTDSIYIKEAEYMKVKCLMGHPMKLKPYQLKSATISRPVSIGQLPKCLKCARENITTKEQKHRRDVLYGTGKEMEVHGRYVHRTKLLSYRSKHTGNVILLTPADMNKFLKAHPPAYASHLGLSYEELFYTKGKGEKP